MNTKNIISILIVIIVIGLGFYMFTKNNKEKVRPTIEDVDSVQSIDTATKQDTTTVIEQNIQNINLENSDLEFDSIDTEINKL